MRILIVENGFEDLKKSRIPLGSYFESLGNEVFYACPNSREKGIHCIPMSRNSLAPLELIKGFAKLRKLETDNSIEAVLSFRLVPNFLNYLASFRNEDVKRIAVITGLGYAFITSNRSINSVIQRGLIKLFYRVASKRIQIIAQNPDDLVDLGVDKGKVILGSGVESNDFKTIKAFDTDAIKLLFVGRLLKSKGINTTIAIFDELRLRNINVSLTIAGTIDKNNPDSINEANLLQLRIKPGVNYLGFIDDMSSVYEECNVLLFPSTYREGVPRVILESLKHGLTIITRDRPGCKETINENGYLIPNDTGIERVVDYISSLDSKKLLKNNMKSKEIFESTFCADVVYPQYLLYLG